MPNEITAGGRQRHGFDYWKGTSRLSQRLFVLNYMVNQGEVPGWEMRKVKQMRAIPSTRAGLPGPMFQVTGEISGRTDVRAESPAVFLLPPSPHATAATVPFELPPAHTRSFWQPEGSSNTLVEAELHECSSVLAAHEWLLQLLAVFESPLIERLEQPEFGDVCFTGPSPTAFLFARANMVVNVRNAGREIVNVTEVARSVDAALIAKPDRGRIARRRARGTKAAAARESHLGSRVPLDLGPEATPAAATPAGTAAAAPTFKVFYTGGEVEAGADRLYFRADQPGSRKLEVYTVDATGRVQFQELRIEVLPK